MGDLKPERCRDRFSLSVVNESVILSLPVTTTVLIVFAVVYLGMILGGLPFFQLDRTGIALLGAIVLVATGDVSLEEAGRSIHAPTLILLFAFMVLSAQLRLGGFYTFVTRRHARVGVPVTLTTLAISGAYLWFRLS